ncbi:MAG: DUF1934 domain-containing protein [Aerococcus sp.]|nr:DUF1934 domain-containing protein [Aerococcus sp.]
MTRGLIKPMAIRLFGQNAMTQDGQTETFPIKGEGRFYRVKQAEYIEYTERTDEGPVAVKLRITADRGMEITRESSGMVAKIPLFTDVERNTVRYTLVGYMPIIFDAEVQQFTRHEGKTPGALTLTCAYRLTDEDGNITGSYKLELKTTPKLL